MEWSLILLKNAFKNINVSLKMAFEQSAHFKRYCKHYIDTYFNEVQKISLNRIALKKGSWLSTIILFLFFLVWVSNKIIVGWLYDKVVSESWASFTICTAFSDNEHGLSWGKKKKKVQIKVWESELSWEIGLHAGPACIPEPVIPCKRGRYALFIPCSWSNYKLT